MKKFMLYFATLASFNCLFAHAEIYKCKEKSGEIVFMDGNSKHQETSCQLVFKNLKTKEADTTIKLPKTELPKEVAPIDAQTQERRDNKRKQKLTNELDLEQKALAIARNQKQQSDVLLHEKNIELLKKEINALK
jgi:hypothetical protein